MLSDQAGHQPRHHGLLVEVAMHHQLHWFRVLRHRDADDGITASRERLLKT